MMGIDLLFILIFLLVLPFYLFNASANKKGWFRITHPWANKAAKLMEQKLKKEYDYLEDSEVRTLVFYYCQYLERAHAWKSDELLKEKSMCPNNYMLMLADVAVRLGAGLNHYEKFASDVEKL